MSSNEKIDRAVQAFNLVTGKDLTRAEGELFAQLLAVARGQLVYPVEQVLAENLPPELWKKGDVVNCHASAIPDFWSPGLNYSVLSVSENALQLSNNSAMPGWVCLQMAPTFFKWESGPQVCEGPAALPAAQWLPGDVICFLGASRENFSAGEPYIVQGVTVENLCVTGRKGLTGVWDIQGADQDWVWVRRP